MYHDDWKEFFTSDDVQYELDEIFQRINTSVMTPSKENLFASFKYCSPKDIRVVIFVDNPDIGYREDGELVSQGLGPSLHKSDTNITKQINNIHKELERSFANFTAPSHGSLENWCEQGVLFICCSMLSPINKISESNIWFSFINLIIQYLNGKNKIVYAVCCNYKKQNYILPMFKTIKGQIVKSVPFYNYNFIGSNIFVQCNYHLSDFGFEPINWTQL